MYDGRDLTGAWTGNKQVALLSSCFYELAAISCFSGVIFRKQVSLDFLSMLPSTREPMTGTDEACVSKATLSLFFSPFNFTQSVNVTNVSSTHQWFSMSQSMIQHAYSIFPAKHPDWNSYSEPQKPEVLLLAPLPDMLPVRSVCPDTERQQVSAPSQSERFLLPVIAKHKKTLLPVFSSDRQQSQKHRSFSTPSVFTRRKHTLKNNRSETLETSSLHPTAKIISDDNQGFI